MNACPGAVKWVGNKTIKGAWNQCNRGDWMLWLLEMLRWDRKVLASIACDCAERVLHLVLEGEDHSRKAIETRRAWVRGEATEEDCRKAARAVDDGAGVAAYAARSAAYAAAWSTSWAAWAASWVARVALDAEGAERKAQADIIRRYVTWQEVRDALEAA